MKFLWGVFVLLCFVFLAAGQEEKTPPSQYSHSLLAYKYLKSLKPSEAKYYRFLSYYNYDDAATRVKTMRFWINQLHLEIAKSFANPVPGSENLLFAIDLREFGWSSAAFSAVARREPYFKGTAVDPATGILLRKFIEVDQDPKSLHIEAIVRADWFFRETMESDRSPSYYDLLYSRFRFTKASVKKETYQKADGYWYESTTTTPGGFVNFPKNEADFERVFAVDKFREHLKEFKIDTRHGAVVDGMENGISIVARQNRLIERIQTSMGAYYKTFDVKESTGKRDFVETLNKDFEFDAGEILVDLPAGGMGALLVNAVGGIVERADNRFAIDTSDLKYDATVRTPGSCFICHELKYIKPQNLVEELTKAGVNLKFKQKISAVAAKGFFLDWIDKLEGEQTRFSKFIAQTSGFRPGENAANLKAWRDEYDKPVDLKKAVRESGVSVPEFKLAAVKSPSGRIAMLLIGKTIPRRTWEVDGYKEIQLQLNASE